ncbi:hypothetical protein BKA69DRAFT_1048429 [Paraphysoderma sedebokerense]|nr:hypothetical protein BKA69DRAFT_1048429 [Paraphysoderma sedebokerense]
MVNKCKNLWTSESASQLSLNRWEGKGKRTVQPISLLRPLSVSTSPSLFTLPDELILHILSFFSTKDLNRLQTALVNLCSLYFNPQHPFARRFAIEKMGWNRIRILSFDISLKSELNLSRPFGWGKLWCRYGCQDKNNDRNNQPGIGRTKVLGRSYFANLINSTSNSSSASSSSLSASPAVQSTSAPHIQSPGLLRFSHTPLPDGSLICGSTAVSCHCRRMEIRNKSDIDEENYIEERLSRLNLDFEQFTDSTKYLISKIRESSLGFLRTLVIAATPGVNDSFIHLTTIYCPHIQTLNISNNPSLTNKSFYYLSQNLPKLTHLTCSSYFVASPRYNDAGILYLLSNRNLSGLDISWGKKSLTLVGMIDLIKGSGVEGFATIRSIDARYCAGVEELLQGPGCSGSGKVEPGHVCSREVILRDDETSSTVVHIANGGSGTVKVVIA